MIDSEMYLVSHDAIVLFCLRLISSCLKTGGDFRELIWLHIDLDNAYVYCRGPQALLVTLLAAGRGGVSESPLADPCNQRSAVNSISSQETTNLLRGTHNQRALDLRVAIGRHVLT